MRRSLAALPAALLLALLAGDARSQKKADPKPKPKPSTAAAEELLKPAPRPKRPELPPSTLPLKFLPGERVALVGNSTAERMSLYGHFEALLHARFPELKLQFRNFGFPADEVSVRQRSADYTKLDDPVAAFSADTYLCFFGWNESFQGEAGVEKFKSDYAKFLREYAEKYPRDDAGSKPRFVLVTPAAFEKSGDPLHPDADATNERIRLYADAVKAVGAAQKLAVVDLTAPTAAAFGEQPGLQFTVNGAHANEAGDKAIGVALDAALFGAPNPAANDTAKIEAVRAAVNDKSWVNNQDYRMVNGWYVYGGRRTYDTETFPREYAKIRNMVAVREKRVWDLAAGKPVAPVIDDSTTGELIVPPTRFGQPGREYSEAKELRYLTPEEFIPTCTLPAGTELKCFADERKFPEIAKPVQLNFDNKGRLWLACMPSYPQWKPGDPRASDKLVILEDTNGDGAADKSTVFYDKLHCPTGFEFYNGGVLVMDQPRVLWLKDTDGDDKADQVVHLLDGWATDDTHHRGGWEWDHTGLLRILEGVATSTTLETPWGPHRSQGAGGAYVVDPRSHKVRQFSLPGMANMWCYTFDNWGQGIVGDGTTPNQSWDTPLSGAQYGGRKGINFILPKGVRPNLGNEYLVSRALPDALQGHLTYACVIQMNGLTNYKMKDDGAGFMGERETLADGKTFNDLVRSTDKHFRPSDPQVGPDGALWFGDWANALIGHMQYSQRDPNRDHTRGRVYRLYAKDKPLITPQTQHGKSVAEVLEQFRAYEWRTHYRARRDLRERPATEVLPAVTSWLARLDANDPEYDRLRCCALWVQTGHRKPDPKLVRELLGAKSFQARAAAARVAADFRDLVPDSFDALKYAANDEHPRVRAEAVRGLSFTPTLDAAQAVVDAATKAGGDYWLTYTAEAALGANEKTWKAAFNAGQFAKGNVAAQKMLGGLLSNSKLGGVAAPLLDQLRVPGMPLEQKNKTMTALAMMQGNPTNGRAVFVRNCTSCHKVGNGEGADFGPNLDKVMERLKTKMKIVESVIDPNAEVDAKYYTTRLDTVDGKVVSGLLVGEDAKAVTIFDGKEKRVVPKDDIEKRAVLKQSSMPEGLAQNMAPAEFLDLVAYLGNLK